MAVASRRAASRPGSRPSDRAPAGLAAPRVDPSRTVIAMANEARDEIAGLGHNNPPEPTPHEAFAAHIDDLFETAKGFLDGDPIASQQQADDVGKLLASLRTAAKDADDARKVEKQPHADAAKAVDAKWKPLTDKAEQAKKVAQDALTPWLTAERDRQAAEARAARAEAERLAEEAHKAHAAVVAGDLSTKADAERLIKDADKAHAAAARLEKARPQVEGGDKAITLRTHFVATLTDGKAALAHYMVRERDALRAWLTEQANKDARAGARVIPGFTIAEESTVV